MQKCPACGHMNRPGVVFCENCGTSLLSGGRPLSTKSLDDKQQSEIESSLGQEIDSSVQGSDTFPKGGTLRMEIEGSPEPLLLKFTSSEVVLGRRDPATGTLPDVDLTPFAGYRMGVSRRHSQIRYTDDAKLEILDLGSSIGTFVNGQRLEPHYPQLLHDGDNIALGQIAMQLRYQKPTGTLTAPTEEKPPAEQAAPTPEKKPDAPIIKPLPSAAKPEKAPEVPVEAKEEVPAQVVSSTPLSTTGEKPEETSQAPQPRRTNENKPASANLSLETNRLLQKKSEAAKDQAPPKSDQS